MVIDKPKVTPTGNYSLLQTSSVLELSRSTLYRMIKSNKIKAHRRHSDGKQVIAGSEILRVWQQTW